jgi:uncharacterized protein (TIGR02147 family)
MKPKQVNIFDYNDFRKFLADYQEARQASEKGFSKSECSRLLGLPNTRSYFSDVLSGKKVTSAFTERFIKLLDLSKEEAQFFRVLVMFNQAQTPDERELYFDQLVSLNRTPKRVLDKKVFTYYNNWYNSVIRALLHMHDFSDDYSGLAKKVFPAITPKQAKEAIVLLRDLKLIEKNSAGHYKPTEKSITTPEYVKDELVKQYQISCLEIARNSLVQNSSMPQTISTNVISVSDQAYKRIQKKIEKFRSEIRSMVHKDEYPASKVYQLDVLLFPNSK